jgi:hypothetical protein
MIVQLETRDLKEKALAKADLAIIMSVYVDPG